MAVPNQKIITVRKEPKPEKGYTYFTWKALDTARAKLKPGAFMLWTYIAQNKDGYEFGLSNADFCGETTMGRDAYNTAVKELIDKRYLVLRSGKTVYDFYELPLQENPITENKEGAVADKSDNQKQENPITVVGKSDNQKQENPTRNIIEYDNNTINDTSDFSAEGGIRACQEEQTTSIPAITGDISSTNLRYFYDQDQYEFINETTVHILPLDKYYRIIEDGVKVVQYQGA